MDIESWFETMPPHVVNDIAREKRFIGFAIHDEKALSFRNQDYIIKDILTMSRKVKNARSETPVVSRTDGKSKPGTNGNGGKTRWANADIRTKEHKANIRELASNVNFVLDTLVELIDDGYDLNIKRTDAGSTVRTMLFCKDNNSVNANGGLSADAPDAWLSLATLIYKHVHLLEGRWFAAGDDDEEVDDWR